MKQKTMIVLVSLFIAMTVHAGIYRHDVPVKKYTDLAAESQFDCVGRLYWKDTRIGSCVLVGDRYVLSAAHCFMEQLTKPDSFYQGKSKVVVNQPYGEYVRDITQYYVWFKGKKYQSKTVHFYPDYLNCNTKHKCDIVLIELVKPVQGIIPASICKTFNELHAEIVGVGYGAHGIANEPEHIDTASEKIAGENVIDTLCGYKIKGQYVSMLCDFDYLGNKKCNRMGESNPRPLEYTTGGGDSGGGAFRKTNNGWELIGICGGNEFGGINIDLFAVEGVGYYGQIMQWQRVSVFADWIEANEK